MQDALTPELLLRAYASGIFPMANGRDDPEIFWVDPTTRGVFPLDQFHISHSLRRHIRTTPFDIRKNTAFCEVVTQCADRPETWINSEIFALYKALHKTGHAHSIEVFDGNLLVGGVYGVVLGGAFFGESMFSHRDNASKTALAYLIDRLRLGGFSLFDTQFTTPHLCSLGAKELSRSKYRQRLAVALRQTADFNIHITDTTAQAVLQRNTQIS
jgi:leucyl/phenylalanyl-tRNA--protein transferase